MGRVSIAMVGGIFALFLLSSCSAISMVDTWRNPMAGTPRFQKVLVASLDKNAENRRSYEDILVGEFARRGIQAIPSYTVLPANRRPNRRALLQTAGRESADGVLLVQTLGIERHTDVQPGYITSTPDFYYPRFSPGWGGGYGGYGYGGYGWGGGYGGYGPYGGGTTWYEPPTAYTYDVATVQVNLISTANGVIVWAASMETLEPDRVVKVAKELAELLTDKLGKEGLL